MEDRARGELLGAYRAYLRNLSRAWEATHPDTREDFAQEASRYLTVVEALVYVVTGQSRRVRSVPTPTTRRAAA